MVRSDGLRQWAFQGKPLFRYAEDIHPGEMSGDGQPLTEDGAVANTLLLEPRPPYPDWIMVHDTDAGQMLANLEGKTIYTYDGSRIPFRRKEKPLDCELDCFAPSGCRFLPPPRIRPPAATGHSLRCLMVAASGPTRAAGFFSTNGTRPRDRFWAIVTAAAAPGTSSCIPRKLWSAPCGRPSPQQCFPVEHAANPLLTAYQIGSFGQLRRCV